MSPKTLICLLLLLFSYQPLRAAGDTLRRDVDIRRVKIHEDIDRLQGRLLAADGTADDLIRVGYDEDVSRAITDIFIQRVDELQDSIEVKPSFDHRLRVKYLTGLQQMLTGYVNAWHRGLLSPERGVFFFNAYAEMLSADTAGLSIAPVIDRYPYEVCDPLVNISNSVFFDNPGYRDAQVRLFREYCSRNPWKILPELETFGEVPFADSLLRWVARNDPNRFYDYAAARNTRVGKLIWQSQDTLVRIIAEIAENRSGRLYFPFLHQLWSGMRTMASITEAMKDSIKYYKLLVDVQVNNIAGITRGEQIIAADELTKMLRRKAVETFITPINALHDEPDLIRFKVLESLQPRDLYYLIVLGEEVIYTSSYKGVYNRMMERMRKPAGDTLLMQVGFDHFRKFIRIAAGYNKLEPFLATMPDSNAQRLMMAFARGLERSGDLEDAVDVADSYGSIRQKEVKEIIDREIAISLQKNKLTADRRSEVIYAILQKIFRSAADTSADLSAQLGIPSVYQVDYGQLADSAGIVVQLVFFYGDQDGAASFSSFMQQFYNPDAWSVKRNTQWVEIRSMRGKPVRIFANLPLDNAAGDDPDAKAQERLLIWLSENKIRPTIVIHRGHSYHLKSTIQQLPATAKIVILGSCGGFHNLNDVLRICPDAHIVSSKEIGTRMVNEPILRYINNLLQNGKGVNWINSWEALSRQFQTREAKERFDNYIPPHRNLGALFLKAYAKAMQ